MDTKQKAETQQRNCVHCDSVIHFDEGVWLDETKGEGCTDDNGIEQTHKPKVTGEGNALRVVEHDLPAYWASYLINGDGSGIEGKDQYEADKFLAEHNLPSPVSCESAGIGSFNGMMCDLETYIFLI